MAFSLGVMYFYLSAELKRKILSELKDCFREWIPQHSDAIDYINHKYSFSQRPQKGVVVNSANASPIRLSNDNFQGTVYSHVMLAEVGDFPGTSIEWVKQNRRKLLNNDGVFPSHPGIYYIQTYTKESAQDFYTEEEWEQIELEQGDCRYYFFVDPLYTARREQVLQVETGNEDEGFLLNVPILVDSLDVYEDDRKMFTGERLILEANKSLEIKTDALSLPTGNIAPSITGTAQEPFEIVGGQNDLLSLTINDSALPYVVPLTPGQRSAEEVRQDLYRELRNQGLTTDDFEVNVVNGSVQIKASKSLEIEDTDAAATLGLAVGQVSPVATGGLFRSYFDDNIELELVIDGTKFTVPFYKGDQASESIKEDFLQYASGSSLAVSLEKGGDYVYHENEGRIEFLKALEVGTKIRASYKYPMPSSGPFGIEPNQSNDSAIPGAIIAFGNRIQDGDKQAIVVYEDNIETAAEYGGRWEMSLSMEVIARDAMTREQMVDGILSYFHYLRREDLTGEGIEITSISGDEAEEMYDDNDQSVYYLGTISMNMQTDWSVQVPRPLIIERVTQTSFETEAANAGLSVPDREEGDLFRVVKEDEFQLEEMRRYYFVGRSHDYDRIK